MRKKNIGSKYLIVYNTYTTTALDSICHALTPMRWTKGAWIGTNDADVGRWYGNRARWGRSNGNWAILSVVSTMVVCLGDVNNIRNMQLFPNLCL